MIDFDRETLIYIVLIIIALLYFLGNSRRAKIERKGRKNKSFRRRYIDRKHETGKTNDEGNGSRIRKNNNNSNK